MRVSVACALGVVMGVSLPARAGQYVQPPILPVADAWQGRSQAVLRVLDKLDAHIETLTLKAGDTGHYKSLAVTVRSCMDRPQGVPHDSAAFLDVQDQHGDTQPFSGWSFADEPAIGVFESPVYGLQLVACQGDLVAPAAPPLPAPVPPPAAMVQNQPDPNQPADGQTDAGDPAMQGGATAGGTEGGAAAAMGQPDPVYPDGVPPLQPQGPAPPQYQPQPQQPPQP
jgi:hypothetical protein